MTKAELTEKIGKKFFLEDDYTLAAVLSYKNGIPSFDEYLNGKSLKQIHAVIHLTKYPKGLLIKIQKNFSSFPFGISYSEINQILLSEEKEISHLFLETVNGRIAFSIKTSRLFEVKQFLKDIQLKNAFYNTINDKKQSISQTAYNSKQKK